MEDHDGQRFTQVGKHGKDVKDEKSIGKDEEMKEAPKVEESTQNEQQMITRVRFEIHTRDKEAKINGELKAMIELLLLQDPTCKIIDKDMLNIGIDANKQFPKSKEDIEKLFDIETYPHKNRSGGKVHVIFNLVSNISINAMNQNKQFKEELGKMRAWINYHYLSTNRIASIGIITKKHVSHVNRFSLAQDLREGIMNIAYRIGSDSVTKHQDNFLLIQQALHVEIITKHISNMTSTINDKSKMIDTTVFEIRCDAKNREEIKELLFQLYNERVNMGRFASYDMINSEKELLTKLIKENNEYYGNCRKFHVYGVHKDYMFRRETEPITANGTCLVGTNKQLLEEMEGIESIEITQKSFISGEYIIITDKKTEHRAKKNMEAWFEQMKDLDIDKYYDIITNEGYENGMYLYNRVQSDAELTLIEKYNKNINVSNYSVNKFTKTFGNRGMSSVNISDPQEQKKTNAWSKPLFGIHDKTNIGVNIQNTHIIDERIINDKTEIENKMETNKAEHEKSIADLRNELTELLNKQRDEINKKIEDIKEENTKRDTELKMLISESFQSCSTLIHKSIEKLNSDSEERESKLAKTIKETISKEINKKDNDTPMKRIELSYKRNENSSTSNTTYDTPSTREPPAKKWALPPSIAKQQNNYVNLMNRMYDGMPTNV